MVKKRYSKILSNFYLVLIFLFLYMPIIVLVINSFNKSKFGGVWNGFTLEWYMQLFKDKSIISSLYNTIIVATLASVIATSIGTLASIGINSMTSRYKSVMLNVSYISMINPDIVIGVSLLSFFSLFQFLKLGYVTLILAHITLCAPYVVFAVLPKLQQLNPNLSEAAQDLGATPTQTFFKVILPEIKPGIISGMIMSFTLSLDDFIISFFTTGAGISTLSIKVYSMTKRGVSPKINALTTLMLFVIIVLMVIIQIRSTKSEKNRY